MNQNEIPDCYKWANDLKIGDVVFISFRRDLSKSKVTKLTPTQIGVGQYDQRYRRQTLSHRIDSWSSYDLLQDTPETEAQYVKQQTTKLIFSLAHDVYNSAVKRSVVEKCTPEQLTELRKKLQDVVAFCGGIK